MSTVRKFEQTSQISLKSFLKIALVLDLLEPLLKSLEAQKTFSTLDEVLAASKETKQ